ncbi:MAG: hypothetical protein K6F27_06215 [Ruminococcus sp.]|nr:hypothetical protein [Ruminococcus sp.]
MIKQAWTPTLFVMRAAGAVPGAQLLQGGISTPMRQMMFSSGMTIAPA